MISIESILTKSLEVPKSTSRFLRAHGWSESYSSAYKEAVNLIMKGVPKETQPMHDALIYPLMFLTRHFLELQLKSALREQLRHLPSCPGVKRKRDWSAFVKPLESHNLKSLAKAIFELGDNNSFHGLKGLRQIESDLKYLQMIDEEATAFRFSTMKNGTKQTVNQQSVFLNCERFEEWINAIHFLFDSYINDEWWEVCSSGACSAKGIRLLKTYRSSFQNVIVAFESESLNKRKAL